MKSDFKSLSEPPREDVAAKQIYQTPKLQTFGGLGDIVKTAGMNGNSDGGMTINMTHV
jgi:hypothetical protein